MKQIIAFIYQTAVSIVQVINKFTTGKMGTGLCMNSLWLHSSKAITETMIKAPWKFHCLKK